MDFVSQLKMTVTPLADYQPSCKPRKYNRNPDHDSANSGKRKIAKDRYRKAMGDGWLTTMAIEDRLGMPRTTASKTLIRYMNLGFIERRAVGGTFNKRWGYEWRWIENG
jgi:hypothetical protein